MSHEITIWAHNIEKFIFLIREKFSAYTIEEKD